MLELVHFAGRPARWTSIGADVLFAPGPQRDRIEEKASISEAAAGPERDGERGEPMSYRASWAAHGCTLQGVRTKGSRSPEAGLIPITSR